MCARTLSGRLGAVVRVDPLATRRGLAVRSPHHRQEPVEQIPGVAGPGPRLGVVLDRGARHVAEDQSLHRAVVEVQVGELGDAEVGLPCLLYTSDAADE